MGVVVTVVVVLMMKTGTKVDKDPFLYLLIPLLAFTCAGGQ